MNYFNRNAHYWVNKSERAKLARQHAQIMERTQREDIAESVSNAVIYGPKMPDPVSASGKPEFIYENHGTTEAVLAHGTERHLCALNFASYKNPGGGFLAGSSAQEETLCMDSDLYNVLSRIPDYYEWNNAHKNRALYTNRALWTPGIIFLKDDRMAIADVITCAAPNFPTAEKYGHVTYEENLAVLRMRMVFLKRVLEAQGVRTFITGAWGCGVFGQKPRDVAKLFREIFANSTIEKIIFAVPHDGHGNANADAFKAACK